MTETYTTTQVATHLHISPRQLQWADEMNVLKPKRCPVRRSRVRKGDRRYNELQALLLALIANLRERGVPLQRLRKHLPAIKSQFKKRLPQYVVLGKDVRFADTPDALLETVTKMPSAAYVVDICDLLARVDEIGETA
jgi:DNA-binding transcriptional MerR regulator